jgi:hypothetical protein
MSYVATARITRQNYIGGLLSPCARTRKPTMIFSPCAPWRRPAGAALDQHETPAVPTHQDWCLLADVKHAGGDFVHALLHERGAAFDRT